jgi:acyl-CoA dehydrogenase
MMNFARERLILAGQCVAIAELAYRESVAYARERKAFGKSLCGLPGDAPQARRHGHADRRGARAHERDAGAHLRGERTCGPRGDGEEHGTDMCSFVCDQAVQIHGGYGYMREYVVERLYRDARLYPIGGGTREIMNEIISKTEGY